MNKLLTIVCTTAVALTTAAGLLGAPAHAAAPTVTIKPAQIERGADISGAHLANLLSRTIVDGDLRIPVEGRSVTLLGKSGKAYVVVVARGRQQSRWSTLRIGPKGGERVLARGTTPDEVVLASDGGLVAITRSQTAARTEVDVLRVRTGRIFASETFAGAPRVLDILGDHAVVGGFGAGTIGWDLGADTTETITRRGGYRADIGADRLATFTSNSFPGDPSGGACSAVTSLTRPQRRLATSCDERVEAFSPDGRRVATVGLLTDGLGSAVVRARTVGGRLIATYRAGFVFGALRFESERALLLDTYGRTKAATVRCTGAACVRATGLTDTPDF